MLLLIDQIDYGVDEIPADLIGQILNMGEILEVRGVAFKSLSSDLQIKNELTITELKQNSKIKNNLYVFWLIFSKTSGNSNYSLTELCQDINRASNKIKFMKFIEDHCNNIFKQNNVAGN